MDNGVFLKKLQSKYPDTYKDAIDLVKTGQYPSAQITAMTGVSSYYVDLLRKIYKVKLNKRGIIVKSRKQRNKDNLFQIIKLLKDGHRVQEVAESLKISRQRVSFVKQKLENYSI